MNFTNANITGLSHVGVIAGCASNVEINSCKISGSTVYAKANDNDGGNYVGLFVGQVNCSTSEKTTITSCSINDTNTVKGIHRFAGFIGFVEDWNEDNNRFVFTSNNLNGTLKLEYDTENTYGTSHAYGSFYSNDDITLAESNKTNGSVTNPKI